MSGAFIEITIHDQGAQDLLDRLSGRVDDMTPVMGDIGEIVTESSQRNFEEHRAPDGTPWEPLAESTKAAKVKMGRNPDDILIMNRILMGSIHPEAHKDRVEIGTDEVYAAIQQLGGMAGRDRQVEIPAREFLGVRDEDWDEIEQMILEDFLGE